MRIDAMEYYKIISEFNQAGFYETENHRRLLESVKSTVLRTGGLIAISGMVGTGKTLMLRRLQETLARDGKIIVSRSLSVEKQRVQLATLIAALFYDLSSNMRDVRIPAHCERRERELLDLIKQGRKPVALFVDEAHDLPRETLKGLKRLSEMVHDGGCVLSVILAGHPKLRNDLKRTTMEEVGYRIDLYSLDGAIDSRRQYIEWLLMECSSDSISKPEEILESEAIDLLAEKLVTPLQIEQHLMLALEAGHDVDEKPVSASVVESILSGAHLTDWEGALCRHGYDQRALAGLLNIQPAEVRQLFRGELDASRVRQLHEKLLVVGLPVK